MLWILGMLMQLLFMYWISQLLMLLDSSGARFRAWFDDWITHTTSAGWIIVVRNSPPQFYFFSSASFCLFLIQYLMFVVFNWILWCCRVIVTIFTYNCRAWNSFVYLQLRLIGHLSTLLKVPWLKGVDSCVLQDAYGICLKSKAWHYFSNG